MSDTSTSQLQVWIDRLNAGDPAARDELIGRACDRLLRLAHKMLQDFRRLRGYEDTDDVLQNALLRLLRALQAAPPATVPEFFRLAATMIRRELLDLARHYFGPRGPGTGREPPGRADRADGTPPPDYEPPTTTHEPSRLAAWAEFHARVASLPPEQRDVFDLVWYQGLTQAEAAGLLGVSEPTVKRRWLAARLRLQAALKDVES